MCIRDRDNNKESFNIQIDTTSSIQTLKELIQQKCGIKSERQILFLHGLVLPDSKTLATLRIKKDCTILLSDKSEPEGIKVSDESGSGLRDEEVIAEIVKIGYTREDAERIYAQRRTPLKTEVADDKVNDNIPVPDVEGMDHIMQSKNISALKHIRDVKSLINHPVFAEEKELVVMNAEYLDDIILSYSTSYETLTDWMRENRENIIKACRQSASGNSTGLKLKIERVRLFQVVLE
eukprot:TRINITY_DN5501_c0_g1_i5.p1 TRINITY_DN5501_c0_g1~~TRINITY_DN5501_c0_g1_i5.p1  ORF type:complete len:256 (+),score=41.01 TRINITY_DN5501_c0_g1_i5:61-768(+)